VVVDRAVRDEGTSHHYLSDERYADATGSLVGGLAAALADRGIARRVGLSWTTDAIFRETTAELEHYRSEGVLTVEMEAAAVFAVASYRGADAVAVLSVFDRLLGDRWETTTARRSPASRRSSRRSRTRSPRTSGRSQPSQPSSPASAAPARATAWPTVPVSVVGSVPRSTSLPSS